MTTKEENYLLDTLERIRDETHENNVMLKSIIKYLYYKESDANGENERDFGRNVLANIVSNIFGFSKR